MIKAERLTVGELETNCYIVGDSEVCAVIDPGAEFERIDEKTKGLKLEAVLLTHGHYDHAGAAAALKARRGARIYMHRADARMIGSASLSLSFLTRAEAPVYEPDVFVENGDVLRFGELEFGVMHTPGHSPGGVSYALGRAVFCGDLIFRRSIGRYDFGDFDEEMASIRRLLAAFPDDTPLLPGHGASTTVGEEKRLNPYLK